MRNCGKRGKKPWEPIRVRRKGSHFAEKRFPFCIDYKLANHFSRARGVRESMVNNQPTTTKGTNGKDEID
jgi:hypothetical protein